jgi:hypothetical protein
MQLHKDMICRRGLRRLHHKFIVMILMNMVTQWKRDINEIKDK